MVTTEAQGRAKRRRSLPILSAVAAAVGLLALAGCGSSSSTTSSSTPSTAATTTSAPAATTTASSPTSSTSTLALEANSEGQLAYNTKTLSASAGKVSIDFTNQAPLAHNVTVEAAGGKILGATPTFQGGSKTLTLQLPAGTYKFFCSVPGHRQAGMEGTLTVK
ncbi:MAG TPA: plastocyanin/azurin family copper-binding protein [Solirubrobacteraceae bacterium]|nr:plastocyanin/azurin family copper-binding protein [Solirubrobacteraceae bacterium]